jgi:hypothetical protein
MKEVASQIAGTLGNLGSLSALRNGWIIPPYDTGNSGADYLGRAIIAVVGLTANTVREAVYYDANSDSAGQPLTGAKKYTLTFASDMSYLTSIPPGFWSLTIYDAASGYTIDNPIDRYSLGSSDDLKKNEDGSFTIYVQHDNPGPDKESNWLPAPQGPFYAILRNYAPIPAVYEPQIACDLRRPAATCPHGELASPRSDRRCLLATIDAAMPPTLRRLIRDCPKTIEDKRLTLLHHPVPYYPQSAFSTTSHSHSMVFGYRNALIFLRS